MMIFDQRILGIAILCLLGLLVLIKQAATGSILDKPKGGALVQAVNIFNLFFLLVVNPLAAVLLIARRLPVPTPSPAGIAQPWMFMGMEIMGLVIYVGGFVLMAWALVVLGRSYQLGGSAPRSEDRLITSGPYRLIRHPMYTAALCIALGLAGLVHGWIILGVFAIYLLLILQLIPVEEKELRIAYGEPFGAYQRETRAIVPFVY